MDIFAEFEPKKQRPLPKKPKHGPYAELYFDKSEWKWKRRLNEEGKNAVSEYLKKYPEPASLVYRFGRIAEWLMANQNTRDELNQRARLAIIEGFMQFDPISHENIKAETFISIYIKGEIFRYIEEEKNLHNGMVYPDFSDDLEGDEKDSWSRIEDKKEKEPVENAFQNEHLEKILDILDGDDKMFICEWFKIDGNNREFKFIAKKWGLSIEQAEAKAKDIIANKIRTVLGIEIN
jgi:DNA-directed RNA polymerase specialized sigma subunit